MFYYFTFSVTDIHFVVVLSTHAVHQTPETSLNFLPANYAVVRKVTYIRTVIRRSIQRNRITDYSVCEKKKKRLKPLL